VDIKELMNDIANARKKHFLSQKLIEWGFEKKS
jgi:hypothetical protein